MIYDFRMYTLRPGATPDYRAGVKELSLGIRQRYGITLAGWYWSEIGALNQVVHIWGYEDAKHMDEGKEAFHNDPDWTGKYLPRTRGLVEKQQTWTMNSPDFAPVYPQVGEIPAEGTPEYIRKNKMVFDFRMYSFKPGAIPSYMAAAEEIAVPLRKSHGISLAGWYYSDIGDLNLVTHIWAYNDLKHFKEGKEAVAADPDWNGKYVPRVRGLLTAQNTYLMNTSEFGPVPE
tara:strand:- start:57 stop:749 length:693 start_codon:yes stop_codon:yes gene_type:complete